MRTRIAHFGTFDVPNYGDLLFPLILERRLADLNVEWVHASPRGSAAVWSDCVSTVNVDQILSDSSPLSAMVVGGGNIIHCAPTALPAYRGGGLSSLLAYPQLWIGPAFVAAKRGLLLWWNAPGVSEPFSPMTAPLARWASTVTDYLAVRDRTSEGWLREAGVDRPVHVVPDTALEVSTLWPAQDISASYRQAFHGRGREVPQRSIAFHVNARFTAEPPDSMARRLDRMCGHGQAVGMLLALGPCHGDDELAREIGGRMSTHPLIIDQPESLREIAACIACSQAYIGSSLHGMITATAFRRRGMVVVPGNAKTLHKFLGFLELVQLTPWRCNGWEEAEHRFADLLSAPAAPWEGAPELGKPMLDAHWKRVRDLLTQRLASGRARIARPRQQASRAVFEGLAGIEGNLPAPLQLVLRDQAARAIEELRTAKRAVQDQARHTRALQEARQAFSDTQARLCRAETELANAREEHARHRRDSEARLGELTQAVHQAGVALATTEENHQASVRSLDELMAQRDSERRDAECRLREISRERDAILADKTRTEEQLRKTSTELAELVELHRREHGDQESRIEALNRTCAHIGQALRRAEEQLREEQREWTVIRTELERKALEQQSQLGELERSNASLAGRLTAADEEHQRLRDEADRRVRQWQAQMVEADRARHEAESRSKEAGRVASYAQLVLRIRDAVEAAIPARATVAVISKGDEELLRLGRRSGRHFPRDERGVYLGYHPATSREAIDYLEAEISSGTRFLLVPQTSHWWMDFYPEFRAYLSARAVCILQGDLCRIYRLTAPSIFERMVPLLRASGPDARKGPPGAHTVPGKGGTPMAASKYAAMVREVLETIDRWVPSGKVVAVISKGDDELLRFRRHRGWHFPQTEQGAYSGYYPENDDEAIRGLESIRRKGAGCLVIPRTAEWWLNHYGKFGKHLRSKYRCVRHDESCRIFDFTPGRVRWWSRRLPSVLALILGRWKTGGSDGPRGEPAPAASPAVGPRTGTSERTLHPGVVTVIIPVFNAYDDVVRCLDSLTRNTPHPHQVIILDDCSPDTRIWPLLESHAGLFAHVHIRRNPANLGFTGTINQGCRLAPGDVVLLNSDTQVTAGWLEKLAACAASMHNVATVTPLSNAAGAFSVPDNNRANPIPPGLTLEDMASLVESLSRRVRPAVPTGNGFCLYVTRRAMNVVGFFDEKSFPRGYGEENDFCMRAKARGFVNLIDDATFIHHRQSASFLDSREELLARSRETLRRLHPTYKREVTEWLARDPLDGLRASLREHLRAPRTPAPPSDSPRPCLLFVIHDGTGGTVLTNADLLRMLEEQYRCLVLRTGLSGWTLLEQRDGTLSPARKYSFHSPWQVQNSLEVERIRVLEDICRGFRVELAHVRHLLGNGPETLETLHRLRIPVVLSFHDYYVLCPTIQLIDDQGVFCGGRCTPGPGDCAVARSWFRGELPTLKHQFVHEHRRRMAEALRVCECFVTTCESARRVLCDALPDLGEADFRVIEHGRELPSLRLASAPRPGLAARVVCLGNIDQAKGCRLIEYLMATDARLGPRFEFHFLGNQSSTFKPRTLGGICHGPYQREELADRLRAIQPSFSLIASIWPETYCHTLTESWSAGLPVLASNLGALRERIERHGGGWLLDPGDADGWYRTMIRLIDSPQAYQKALDEVAVYKPRSTKQMADDYRGIYAECLARRKRNP